MANYNSLQMPFDLMDTKNVLNSTVEFKKKQY